MGWVREGQGGTRMVQHRCTVKGGHAAKRGQEVAGWSARTLCALLPAPGVGRPWTSNIATCRSGGGGGKPQSGKVTETETGSRRKRG